MVVREATSLTPRPTPVGLDARTITLGHIGMQRFKSHPVPGNRTCANSSPTVASMALTGINGAD